MKHICTQLKRVGGGNKTRRYLCLECQTIWQLEWTGSVLDDTAKATIKRSTVLKANPK